MNLEALLAKSKISEEELRQILSTGRRPVRFSNIAHDFGSKHIKIGLISDMHIGSKYFSEFAFDKAVKKFTAERVDAIYCPGDILEGMSGRDGHIYELADIGYQAQKRHAVELLKGFKQPFYFIVGNHDLWFKNKANMGIDVGMDIEKEVPNCKYLGEMEAKVRIGRDCNLWLTHRGSSSYALSYSGQKMMNGLSSENKPHIIFNGHIHKAVYLHYRNIHYLESGAIQRQTEFMAMKGSPAMVGFWVCDVKYSKRGVQSFKPEWNPVYE